MRLRHAMFSGGVAGFPLLRSNLPSPGNAALELRADVLPRALFERIGAAGDECCEKDREEERPGLHLLILGTKL